MWNKSLFSNINIHRQHPFVVSPKSIIHITSVLWWYLFLRMYLTDSPEWSVSNWMLYCRQTSYHKEQRLENAMHGCKARRRNHIPTNLRCERINKNKIWMCTFSAQSTKIQRKRISKVPLTVQNFCSPFKVFKSTKMSYCFSYNTILGKTLY